MYTVNITYSFDTAYLCRQCRDEKEALTIMHSLLEEERNTVQKEQGYLPETEQMDETEIILHYRDGDFATYKVMKASRFISPKDMLEAILSGQDFYCEKTGDYVFRYSEDGAISVYRVGKEEAKQLAVQSGYWSGGDIYEDPMEYLNLHYPDDWKDCRELEKPELSLKTPAGILRAVSDLITLDEPGIALTLQPKGFQEEIDLAFAFSNGWSGEKEDLCLLTYHDPSSEDYTHKRVFQKKDFVEILGR